LWKAHFEGLLFGPQNASIGSGFYFRGVSVRIAIDAEKCQGHNRCYALAPDMVDVDDMGIATILGDGTVASENESKARLLVANCPEYAITISER
jgi:ferredoxin